MDSDQQTRLASQQNPETAARIVRSIADVERDATFAWGPLSEMLLRAVAAGMRKAAPTTWEVEDGEWGASLACREWRATKGIGHDAWLQISDVFEEEQEDEHSWTAVIVSAGTTKLCLELMFRPGLTPFARTLGAKNKLVANVVKEGFELDKSGTRLLIPIQIDPEALAKGLEFNDPGDALAPVAHAVERALKAKPDLDALIDHVRKGRTH